MAPLATLRTHIREHGGTLLARAVAIVVLAFLLFIAIGGVSHQGRWRISTINITGAAIVPADDVRALVEQEILGNYYWVYARDNSFLFPKHEIEEALIKKFPRLESVIVSRTDDHTITIALSERKPHALWCGDTFDSESSNLPQCWFIDTKGFVFDDAPIISSGVYLEVYGPLEAENADMPIGEMLPSERFLQADKLVGIINLAIGQPLRLVFNADDEYEVTLNSSAVYPMLTGVTLKMNDGMDPSTTVDSLQSALKEEFPTGIEHSRKLLYVDMRFGNKIFFGFAN